MEFIYISQICFFISLILLLTQGIINYEFYVLESESAMEEKTLYEQFAYEVYSSINKILKTNIEFKEKCSRSEELIQFNLNLDTYYDCKGIFSDLGPCENTIINNYTICSSDGIGKITNWYKFEVNLNDENVLNCIYYSKFTRKINKLFGKQLCSSKNKLLTYEFLLKNSIDNINNNCQNNYKKCGVLDTYNNILCLPEEYNCPMNEISFSNSQKESLQIRDNKNISLQSNTLKPIINSIIISENPPLNHEWDLLIRETFEKIDDKSIQKRKNLTYNFHNKIDETYDLLENSEELNLTVYDIASNNSIKGINSNIYNLNQNLDIYVRNYIGFKNIGELNEFQKIFNDKDYRDNPLYKLSSSVYNHDPLVTIIISAIFICIIISYFILYYIKKLSQATYKYLFFIFLAFICIFFLGELIIFSDHYKKYNIINIDMDKKMKEVLDKYNRRIITCQLYRIISSFINIISIIFWIVSYKKDGNQFRQLQ